MAITATDVKNTINSEFSTISDSVVEDYIVIAQLELDATIWSTWYDRASVLLTRHMIAVEMKNTSATTVPVGPVTSMSTGPVRIGYGSSSMTSSTSTSDLGLTSYGQQFQTLMTKVIQRVGVI